MLAGQSLCLHTAVDVYVAVNFAAGIHQLLIEYGGTRLCCRCRGAPIT